MEINHCHWTLHTCPCVDLTLALFALYGVSNRGCGVLVFVVGGTAIALDGGVDANVLLGSEIALHLLA